MTLALSLSGRPPHAGVALPLLVDELGGAAPAELAGVALGPRDIRHVATLRLSITDRCNFRCQYCMPAGGVEWLPKADLLSLDEIVAIVRAALGHGIADFKLTGGEPLLRPDLCELVRELRSLSGVRELSLTTNGLLLARLAGPLRRAGLDRVTVSLDTLNPTRFREITGGGDLRVVLDGIAAADSAGLGPVKLNVVVMRGVNDDEIADLAGLTLAQARTVRFIEFMPLGRSRCDDRTDALVPYREMRARIEARFGVLAPAARDSGSGPARVFSLPGARGRVGFIHAMSDPFCSTCNRLRLTPEGLLRSCLFDGGEIDLRAFLRPRTDSAALSRAFVDCVRLKPTQHRPCGERQMSRIGG